MKTLEQVLVEYGISYLNTEQITTGLINQTWKIFSQKNAFIVQRVSSIFKPSVMDDIQAVQNHLSAHGLSVAKIVPTKSTRLYVLDDGCFWRVFEYIDGTSYDSVPEPDIAYKAGEMLGTYHKVFSTLEYTFKHGRAIKHNIPMIYEAFQQSLSRGMEAYENLAKPLDRMLELVPPESFPHSITHGDPKISNFLFSKTSPNDAICIIDLDDCGKRYSPVVELASALKSWCQVSDDATENQFNIHYFESAIQGYTKGSQGLLTEELQWLPKGIELMALQLAARFFTDAVKDTYFAWDSARFKSRKEHNTARFMAHMYLYNDIVRQRDDIKTIVDKI